MDRHRIRIISLLIFGLCCVTMAPRAQVPVEVGKRDWANTLPDGEGKGLLLGTCTQCHSLNHVALQRKDAKGWEHTMEDMIMRGAQVQVHEIAPMVAYLTRHFGPDSPPLESGSLMPTATEPASTTRPKSDVVTLPEGEGKDLITRSCTQCHGVDKITGTRKDLKGWQACVKDMVRLGAKLSPAEQQKVVAYMVERFGRR